MKRLHRILPAFCAAVCLFLPMTACSMSGGSSRRGVNIPADIPSNSAEVPGKTGLPPETIPHPRFPGERPRNGGIRPSETPDSPAHPSRPSSPARPGSENGKEGKEGKDKMPFHRRPPGKGRPDSGQKTPAENDGQSPPELPGKNCPDKNCPDKDEQENASDESGRDVLPEKPARPMPRFRPRTEDEKTDP